MFFDKIASVYFIWKYINILASKMASPGNRHCASFIGALSFPVRFKKTTRKGGSRHFQANVEEMHNLAACSTVQG